ncbi:hypothetical protein RAA17_01540 [Komagataeibacter rhaeticus]|nr:hypothetical protein [Komagataeibacter rhaeticus]
MNFMLADTVFQARSKTEALDGRLLDDFRQRGAVGRGKPRVGPLRMGHLVVAIDNGIPFQVAGKLEMEVQAAQQVA